MQTEMSFEDAKRWVSFPNRIAHGNATTCVSSNAIRRLVSLIPTSFP